MHHRIQHNFIALATCALLGSCAVGTDESEATQTTNNEGTTTMTNQSEASGIYAVDLHALDGTPASLDAYRGRALLLVNVASKCGLTPQYAKLEELQQNYSDRGLTVIGFPCNQFGGQEPGSQTEIRAFCSENYGVSFPLMEKLDVNGADRHPLYEILTATPDATGAAGDVQWNFEKFVVSADGETITRFRPRTAPDDPAVVAAIEAALPR